jgi:hypothetical protein
MLEDKSLNPEGLSHYELAAHDGKWMKVAVRQLWRFGGQVGVLAGIAAAIVGIDWALDGFEPDFDPYPTLAAVSVKALLPLYLLYVAGRSYLHKRHVRQANVASYIAKRGRRG